MLLGDACSIRSGLTLRERLSEASGRGIIAVQQGDLSPSGEFGRAGALRITAPDRSSHRVNADELVFRSRGPFWSAWAPGAFDEPLVAVAPLFILHPNADIDPRYLAWYIGRPEAQRFFASEAMGTSVKMIPRSVLERLPLALPPLHTQRTIADVAALVARERTLTRQLADLRHDLLSAGLDQTTRVGAADVRSAP